VFNTELFRELVSVKGFLYLYDEEAPGGLGPYQEADTLAYRKGVLSPWVVNVLTLRRARYRLGLPMEFHIDDLRALEGMALGSVSYWDGLDGEPVAVRCEEDPEGVYWLVGSEVVRTAAKVLSQLGVGSVVSR